MPQIIPHNYDEFYWAQRLNFPILKINQVIDFVDLITILIDVRSEDPGSPYWSLANESCGASGEQRAKPVVGFALCVNFYSYEYACLIGRHPPNDVASYN